MPEQVRDQHRVDAGADELDRQGVRPDPFGLAALGVVAEPDLFAKVGDDGPRGPVGQASAPGRLSSGLTLRETLLAGLEDAVAFGKEFLRYQVLPTGEVRAHFADGNAVTGDLLVAADGVSSRVRQQHLPHATLVDTGMRWVGGKTLLDDALRHAARRAGRPRRDHPGPRARGPPGRGALRHIPNQAAETLWPGLRFTHNEDYVMWAIVGDEAQLGITDQALTAMTPAQLHQFARDATAGGQPLLDAVVRAGLPDSCFSLAIRATTPVTRWPSSPVTLLGDAIHAGPVNGTGANSALRDAALLCRHLISAARGRISLTDAIAGYEIGMLHDADLARQAWGRRAATAAGQTAQLLGNRGHEGQQPTQSR